MVITITLLITYIYVTFVKCNMTASNEKSIHDLKITDNLKTLMLGNDSDNNNKSKHNRVHNLCYVFAFLFFQFRLTRWSFFAPMIYDNNIFHHNTAKSFLCESSYIQKIK